MDLPIVLVIMWMISVFINVILATNRKDQIRVDVYRHKDGHKTRHLVMVCDFCHRDSLQLKSFNIVQNQYFLVLMQ